MRIDYASSAMDAQDFANLFENSPKAPGQQAQKFNRLMIQGLAENGAVVRAVTARPVTGTNCPSKFLSANSVQRGKVRYHYCSVLNVKGIKILWQTLSAFVTVLFAECFGGLWCCDSSSFAEETMYRDCDRSSGINGNRNKPKPCEARAEDHAEVYRVCSPYRSDE